MNNGEKISARQATRSFLIATAAPIIVTIPTYTALFSQRGAWISALIGLVICILIVKLFDVMFGNKGLEISGFDKALNLALGKKIAKIILLIVAIVLILMTSVRIRLFAERIRSMVFINASPQLLMIVFIGTVLVTSKLKLKFIGRFMELMEVILIVVFVIVIAVAAQNFDITNFYPITIYDFPGILKGSIGFLGIMSVYSFVFYLGDCIGDKENLFKTSISATAIFVLTGLGIICITIGAFGYDIVNSLSQPFFMALKNSNLLGVLEGIESIFVSFWTLADFCICIYNVTICGAIFKKIFNLSSRTTMITPVIFISYMISEILSKNIYEINKFINFVIIPIDIMLGILLPFICYLLIRIKFKKSKSNIANV